MERARLLLIGLPIFLFCTDIFNLFTPKPAKTTTHYPLHDEDDDPQPDYQPDPQKQQLLLEPLKFPTQQKSNSIRTIGIGSTIYIEFCTSCSYRGSAIAMKNMLAIAFLGMDVVLANHPPSLPRCLLSKLVPVFQVGVIGTIMAGEHVFSRVGITPPPWYQCLKANRFGSIASTWVLGNVIQSFLQSTGAFEVYCTGELVFSKLKEERFPSEIELKDLVGKKLARSRPVRAGLRALS